MIVLDTHAWIWWVTQSGEMPAHALEVIEASASSDSVYVSAISAWEVSLLVKRGRLELTMDVEDWVARSESLTSLRFVPVDTRIAVRSTLLPEPLHKDPADRIIIATALALRAPIVTRDEKIRNWPHVETVWES